MRQLRSPSDESREGLGFSSSARRDDGRIELRCAADAMSAEADLYPPLGDGLPLAADYVAELLARLGISHGVDWDVLGEAILDCNANRRPLRGVAVATGSPPRAERPEHIVPVEELLPGYRPVDEKALNVDWKERLGYSVVRAGQVVARVIEAQPGQEGLDVYGRPVPFSVSSPTRYVVGKNLERRDDDIVATVDGRLCLDGLKLSVEQILVVKGDVDYRVGHVMFPGDVVIEGGVAAGFKVYSGGSVSIKETMDAFDVSVKRDLLCAQGIIGKEQGFVRVGGKLQAKFIENARCAVRGDAEVPGSIVGSNLYILGKLVMGDKGRIVGGETYATHGLLCGFIGGPTRPLTVVHAGVDFTMQQKLDKASAELKALSARLAQLERMIAQRAEPSYLRMRDETKARLATLASGLAELSKRVDVDEGAVVEARGGVYPGAEITICHVRIQVTEPLKKTRFRLDRVANRIVVEH